MIQWAAFSDCTSLASITIPNSVNVIEVAAFISCPSLTNISVGVGNSIYSSLDGVLLNKTQTSLITFPAGRVGSYTIPDGVLTIADLAFYSCPSLSSVTFPASLTDIGDGFHFCTGLTNLTFLGNAPSYWSIAEGVGAGAAVYYYYGTVGWGELGIFGGLPAVMLGAPAPQVGTGSAGVKPGGYGFSLTGVVNQTIVVEASTNLAYWQPLWTNTLSAVSTNFVDPEWLNFPHRYYRARSN